MPRPPGRRRPRWPRRRRPRAGSTDDRNQQASLMVRAPVHGAFAFRALLVGGRELPGEQVAWPEPAARDNQPQRFPDPEEGRGRAEGYVSGDDLPWSQRLTVGAGGYRGQTAGSFARPGSAAMLSASRW